MRYFFVACLLFAALPQVLFAADDEYVLRIAHCRVENSRQDAEALDKLLGKPIGKPPGTEIDAVELAIKLGTPFDVTTRIKNTTIKVAGVVRHELKNGFALREFSYSHEITETDTDWPSLWSFATDIDLAIGPAIVVGGAEGPRAEKRRPNEIVVFREVATCELIDAATAKAKVKAEAEAKRKALPRNPQFDTEYAVPTAPKRK